MRKTAHQHDNYSFAPCGRSIPVPISALAGRHLRLVAVLLMMMTANAARAQTYVHQEDSLALVNFYRKTNGPSWKNKSNWLVGPVHTWWGVTIVGTRVRILALPDNNLRGEIPSDLGDLSRLEVLELGFNRLHGWVPWSLGELDQLEVLNLENNPSLTGALPGSLADLRRLHTLNAANTTLCHSSNIGGYLPGPIPFPTPYCSSRNDPPEFIRGLPETTIKVGEPFIFDMFARDSNGDALRYIITPSLPRGAILDPVKGEFSWTPSTGQSCHYHLTTRVTDGLDEAVAHSTISVVSADTLNNYCAPDSWNTPLGPGDIAIVGMNVEYNGAFFEPPVSEFAFVALVDLPRGTQISFTNSGWKSNRSFMRDRGNHVYTAPEFVSRGSVITIQFRFERDGDQIIAFQGSRGAPRFLYALNNHRLAEWQPDAGRDYESALPDGLENGFTALAIRECRNSVYAGVTVGTQRELLHAISDKSNWLCSYTPPHDLGFSFTVTDTEKPPVFTTVFSDKSLVIGEPFSFNFNATNPNNSILDYVISPEFPDGVDFDRATGQMSWTPMCRQDGVFDHRVTVSDGWRTSWLDLRINVADVITDYDRVFADTTILAGVPFAADLSMSGTEGISYTILPLSPAGSVLDAETGSFAWTPTESQVGPHILLARASDGCKSRQYYFRIVVKSAILGPVFTSGIEHRIVRTGETTTLSFAAESPRGEEVAISILVTGPANPCEECVIWDTATSSMTWTAERTGIFSLTVKATDESGESTYEQLYVAQIGPSFESFTNLAMLRVWVSHEGQSGRTVGFKKAREKILTEIDIDENGRVHGIYSGKISRPPRWNDPGELIYSSDMEASHLWPEEWGAGGEPQRSDLYNLFATRSDVHQLRGDLPYVEIPDEETLLWIRDDELTDTAPTSDRDQYSEWSEYGFEPRESVKGDIARAMFYFYTTYNVTSDHNFFAEQRQTLLDWAARDPLSADEILRAVRIEALQGNINPFLLDPTLPDRVWGISTEVGYEAELPLATRLLGNYPNPFRKTTKLQFELMSSTEVIFDFYDVLGRRVETRDLGLKTPGTHHIEWTPERISPGLYFCVMRGVPAAGRLLMIRR